ncbi:membrane protein [Gordonia phage Woes]|uniref:Membrane protein n=1 Tax=Gordonia phage Woes TaxID=1838084 RepID=A0A160DDL8_9CAUD|nr:membrane protein [Gordonia phage Woes]ANA85812.1 membrane protein [Gordonia phage Woes]
MNTVAEWTLYSLIVGGLVVLGWFLNRVLGVTVMKKYCSKCGRLEGTDKPCKEEGAAHDFSRHGPLVGDETPHPRHRMDSEY